MVARTVQLPRVVSAEPDPGHQRYQRHEVNQSILQPDSAYSCRWLADLAVRVRVRSSREGSRSVRK